MRTNPSIHKAAAHGDIKLLRELLDRDPSLVDLEDEYGWRPLFYAGIKKHAKVVQLLIDRGADVSAHNGDALHYAGQVPSNRRIVELLIQYGAVEAHTRPASDSARQFIHAIFMDNPNRVAALLRTSPGLVGELYARGDTALLHACRLGDLEVVQVLVDYDLDVNARNEIGQFPLYCAAAHGHAPITVFLLEHGADLELQLADGRTIIAWLEQNEQEPRFRRVLAAIGSYKYIGPTVNKSEG